MNNATPNYIDLTHTVTDDMPVYPGDPAAKLNQIASIEKEGYVDHQIITGMHVGTHIDAPAHFINDGQRLDEIDPSRFFGRGKILNAQGRAAIDEDLLNGVDIQKDDIVLVCTGHDKKYGRDDYYQSYPLVTEAFAKRLVALEVKMLGLDTPSPDSTPYSVHHILLGNNILIIENMTGLEDLAEKAHFDVIALPPKLRTEGAPVRVIALTTK